MSRSTTAELFRLARLSASVRAVRTGHAGRRLKNIAVGRALFGARGVLRWIWR